MTLVDLENRPVVTTHDSPTAVSKLMILVVCHLPVEPIPRLGGIELLAICIHSIE